MSGGVVVFAGFNGRKGNGSSIVSTSVGDWADALSVSLFLFDIFVVLFRIVLIIPIFCFKTLYEVTALALLKHSFINHFLSQKSNYPI